MFFIKIISLCLLVQAQLSVTVDTLTQIGESTDKNSHKMQSQQIQKAKCVQSFVL